MKNSARLDSHRGLMENYDGWQGSKDRPVHSEGIHSSAHCVSPKAFRWKHVSLVLNLVERIWRRQKSMKNLLWSSKNSCWTRDEGDLEPLRAVLGLSWRVLGGLGTVLVHLDLQHPRKLKKIQKKTQFLPPKSPPKKIKMSLILRHHFETPFEKVLEPIFCLCKPQDKPKGAQTAVGRCEKHKRTSLEKCSFPMQKP